MSSPPTLTSRERFRRALRYEPVDRAPRLEWTIRKETVDAWQREGLGGGEELLGLCPADRWEEIQPDLEPYPAPRAWPRSAADLRDLEKRLDAGDPRRLPEDWEERVRAWKSREHILLLRVHRGLLLSLGVAGWQDLTEALLLLRDDPPLAHAVLGLQARFSLEVARRVLAEVDVDGVVLYEPIAGPDRPLVSPEDYEGFALGSYRPMLRELAGLGTQRLIFRTWANSEALLPGVLACGFDTLWACESDPGSMSYPLLRERFGSDLRLIGGIDLDSLRRGSAEIDRELTRVLLPLLAEGGYAPGLDGRVREDVPWQSYAYYCRRLRGYLERRSN